MILLQIIVFYEFKVQNELSDDKPFFHIVQTICLHLSTIPYA